MNPVSRRCAVITGTSTGIGWGCAKVLLAKGFHVFGSVRTQSDADRLSKEFGADFTPLIFDVTDAAAVSAAADIVESALGGRTLFGLVNNAGITVPGPLLDLKVDDFRHQIDVNLTGPLIVTQAFALLLGADRARQGEPGRIVMISSAGARNAMPFFGPYAASKSALEGLSEALRRELMLFGIDVIVVAPGSVMTPNWGKAIAVLGAPGSSPYAAALATMKDLVTASGLKGLPPETLGEVVMCALTALKPKARYAVPSPSLRSLLVSMLPKRIVDNRIARRLALRRSPHP
jgi:NAD(P)-dependent dehydrogenase (short-subunit alcohol dehydrogenase family)